ncbi:MAG: hypothetical protein ABSF18_03475 [Gammaproteobacteria bacterium]|jgi:hypothetical protein
MLYDDALTCEELLKTLSDTTPVIDWQITEITEEQAHQLASYLKNNAPCLTSFIFNCEKITPAAYSIILTALTEARSLQQLVLYPPLTSAQTETIVNVLNNNRAINDLYLACTEPTTVEPVFNLTKLNNLTLIGFDLANAQFENLSRLKKLNLRKCQLSDSLQQLVNIAQLSTLEIADINLKDEQIQAISKYTKTGAVTKLALPNTQLNDEQASVLLVAFIGNSAVDSLDFQKNNLTTTTVAKISTLMQNGNLDQLKNLKLLHNRQISVFDQNLIKIQVILADRSSENKKIASKKFQ